MEDPGEVPVQQGPGRVPVMFASLPGPASANPTLLPNGDIQNQAVSMANNDCSPTLSSPAEASPARPNLSMFTSLANGTFKRSPTTSDIASASDSLRRRGTRLVKRARKSVSQSLAALAKDVPLPDPVPEMNLPAELTFKGVGVTLENNSVWNKFHTYGTEMILTKKGRRMFPYCRYHLVGLNPNRLYSLVLSIVPANQHKYRWNANKWEVSGPAEHQSQGLIRAFSHHRSPCLGSEWMDGSVSFYMLKLTNNVHDQDGHIIVHSMHRYIPMLHVIPVPDGKGPTPDQPIIKGPESMTFTFPQTEFLAVTTYQNPRIVQLKIDHNPFAKGFREDGLFPRLGRSKTEVVSDENTEAPPADPQTEEAVNLTTKEHAAPASPADQGEAVTPALQIFIMTKTSCQADAPSGVAETLVEMEWMKPPAAQLKAKRRGRPPKRLRPGMSLLTRPSAAGLVTCDVRSVETEEGGQAVRLTPRVPRRLMAAPKRSAAPPASTPGFPRKRRKINRRWGNSRGSGQVKARAPASMAAWSPALTGTMQPEMDDVEGLLFVSFTSKEALGIHVGDKSTGSPSQVSPVSPAPQLESDQMVEIDEEGDEEKIERLQAILLEDLRVFKHRQVIHPVLQEVGLKLSSLDPSKAIDLNYLGVRLPPPSPRTPDQSDMSALSSTAGVFPNFVSRTGKTSDLTKIKGWRDKFIRSQESSHPKQDRSQKDLSAFCSNMLDEYLENEAQQISDRAAAFSTNFGGSVAYELPAKSSSYVKTLDSALKQRNLAPKPRLAQTLTNRPCPLSFKPLLYSALTAPPPPLGSLSVETQLKRQPEATKSKAKLPASKAGQAANKTPAQKTAAKASAGAKAAQGDSPTSPRSPKSALSPGTMHQKGQVLSKFQLKLLEMEEGSLNQGVGRTQLTPERLSAALSVVLTATTLAYKQLGSPQYQKASGPECGKEFCRLGCVCSSLNRQSRGPLHCQRPDCMLGCTCFKRKIVKQLGAAEAEKQPPESLDPHPLYCVRNAQHEVPPGPGSHSNRLWDPSAALKDLEPVFAPKEPAPSPTSSPQPMGKRGARTPQLVPGKDKDAVYKYLESLMTCARVRGFKPQNSAPPPNGPPLFSTKTQQKNPQNLKTTKVLLTLRNEGQSAAHRPSMHMEVHSDCRWDQHRRTVLSALCQRMNHDGLVSSFSVGPYHVCCLSKIFSHKEGHPIVIYKVHISKPVKTSNEEEEEESDCSNKEEQDSSSSEEDQEDRKVEKRDGLHEVVRVGVTPFLGGVVPAGRLRARIKPRGSNAKGLIQVNSKSYSEARVMLGTMGSLHPANRLAAFVMGRLRRAAVFPEKRMPCAAAASTGSVSSAGIPGKMSAVLNTETGQGEVAVPTDTHLPSNSSSSQHPSIQPLVTFVAGQHGALTPQSHSTSSSSSVCLTVSPTLKTPAFLGQSGTYSFRICPPAASQQGAPSHPGRVMLPGGFTLIQLPRHGADGEFGRGTGLENARKSDVPVKTEVSAARTDTTGATAHLAPDRSSNSGSRSKPTCDKKMVTDGRDTPHIEDWTRPLKRELDEESEEDSSDSSDYGGEDDPDLSDELVDVETIEEPQRNIDVKWANSGSEDSGSSTESRAQSLLIKVEEEEDSGQGQRRKKHKVLERIRRSEQRHLFNRLQSVLDSDPRSPKLRVLSQAVSEIRILEATSRCLQKKKKVLSKMQSVYVKDISRLSGRPEVQIRNKLMDIYEKKKRMAAQKNKRLGLPFNPTPQPRLTPKPRCRFQLQTSIIQSKVRATPPPKSLPKPQSLPRPQPPPKPQPQTLLPNTPAPGEVIRENPDSVQVTELHSRLKNVSELTAAKSDLDSLQSWIKEQLLTPSAPPQADPPSQAASTANSTSMTLPLIRSKTGRLILPSSLKPVGQGFYTITIVDGEKVGKDREDSKDKERLSPESPEQPLNMSSEDGKNPQIRVAAKTETTTSLNFTLSPLYFSQRMNQNQAQGNGESGPPEAARHGGGKPCKGSLVSRGNQNKQGHTKKILSRNREDKDGNIDGTLAPGRKRRGRPKRKHPEDGGPGSPNPPAAADLGPGASSRRSRVKAAPSPVGQFGVSGVMKPVTRGALGKNFPSAKRKSWIDLEKELELE